MSHRYVALLRGINVGGANRVAMADLREIALSLGYAEPRTLLNSGNLLFTATGLSPEDASVTLEAALLENLSVTSPVTVLTAGELAGVIAHNPLLASVRDPSHLVVGFFREKSEVHRLEPLTTRDWRPEELALGDRELYAWCAEGIASSPLLLTVDRLVGPAVTNRNWATVVRIMAALAGSP